MLGKRWPNIITALSQRLVLSTKSCEVLDLFALFYPLLMLNKFSNLAGVEYVSTRIMSYTVYTL